MQKIIKDDKIKLTKREVKMFLYIQIQWADETQTVSVGRYGYNGRNVNDSLSSTTSHQLTIFIASASASYIHYIGAGRL